MNIHTILTNTGTLLREDATLAAWILSTYGGTVSLYTGINTQNPPASTACPLIILFPEGKVGGHGADEKEHHIRIRLEIYNDDLTTVDDAHGTWIKYDALDDIETFVGHVLKAIWDGLASIGVDFLQIGTEYETIENFPFVFVDLNLTMTIPMTTASNLYD